jgi:hypothetical protein
MGKLASRQEPTRAILLSASERDKLYGRLAWGWRPMKARLVLSIVCIATALGGVLSACASSEGTTTPEGDSGSLDSTIPEDGGGDVGKVDSGVGTDAKSDADATASDTGAGDGTASDVSADGVAQDATTADTTTVDTGGQDSATDTLGLDIGVDTEAGDSGGGDAEPDSTGDTGQPEGAVESGADAVVDAGADGTADAANDAGQDSGVGQGPVCQYPDGGIYFCNAGEHCCGNAATRASTCATACDEDAGFNPIDCPGASGDGGCGSLICCATLQLGGGIPPACPPVSLTSSCASSCAGENPPALCGGTSTVRLCTAASDCASDTPNPHCCNYGSPPSPVNWCVSDLIYNLGLQNSCL